MPDSPDLEKSRFGDSGELYHGLRTPNGAFFLLKSRIFGHRQTNCVCKIWGIRGIFGRFISTYFGTVSPLSVFSINQPFFYKKLSLYIQIPNIYLGLGFEFGQQRIRDLAIVCPKSVLLRIILRIRGHKTRGCMKRF